MTGVFWWLSQYTLTPYPIVARWSVKVVNYYIHRTEQGFVESCTKVESHNGWSLNESSNSLVGYWDSFLLFPRGEILNGYLRV